MDDTPADRLSNSRGGQGARIRQRCVGGGQRRGPTAPLNARKARLPPIFWHAKCSCLWRRADCPTRRTTSDSVVIAHVGVTVAGIVTQTSVQLERLIGLH